MIEAIICGLARLIQIFNPLTDSETFLKSWEVLEVFMKNQTKTKIFYQ